jgi:peptide-methionine (S)-S-oxide reductase
MICVEVATLGGGYFWCTEAVLRRLRGLMDIKTGYIGGDRPNPTYKQICTGTTGHAEVVQINFDPDQISYRGVPLAPINFL